VRTEHAREFSVSCKLLALSVFPLLVDSLITVPPLSRDPNNRTSTFRVLFPCLPRLSPPPISRVSLFHTTSLRLFFSHISPLPPPPPPLPPPSPLPLPIASSAKPRLFRFLVSISCYPVSPRPLANPAPLSSPARFSSSL